MGLNRAVIVVGGCEGGPLEAIESGEDEMGGTWNDGGVASGRVVKRIPVETVWEPFTFVELEGTIHRD